MLQEYTAVLQKHIDDESAVFLPAGLHDKAKKLRKKKGYKAANLVLVSCHTTFAAFYIGTDSMSAVTMFLKLTDVDFDVTAQNP